MDKIKDYFKKYRGRICGLVLLLSSVFGLGLYKLYKTNAEMSREIFVVSNYDIGRGYRFVYNAKESGWEYLVERRGEYDIFVETEEPNEGFKKTEVQIQFRNLGKKHPLSNKMMIPNYFLEDSGFGERVDIGEALLNKTRKQYEKYIPFEKIRAKIKE